MIVLETQENIRRGVELMKTHFSVGALTVTAGLAVLVAGCGTQAPNPSTVPTQTNTTSQPAASTNTTNTSSNQTAAKTAKFTLQVITDQKNGTPKQVPAVVPGNLTLPENTDVTITVQNYDDGAAPLVAASEAQVTGTLNNAITTDGKTVSSVPASKVAHTITIAATGSFKGLNVPIEQRTSSEKYNTVVFTFHTPSTPTKLAWECMAKCGTGSTGMGGVMNWPMDPGYMSGTWTVQ